MYIIEQMCLLIFQFISISTNNILQINWQTGDVISDFKCFPSNWFVRTCRASTAYLFCLDPIGMATRSIIHLSEHLVSTLGVTCFCIGVGSKTNKLGESLYTLLCCRPWHQYLSFILRNVVYSSYCPTHPLSCF